MKKDQRKGIFCLEQSGWFGTKDKTTFEPVLRLLETGLYRVPYLHHDVGTREEFYFYLRKWSGTSFNRYPILYLGFHGTRGGIRVGEGRSNTVKLTELSDDDRLGNRCKGRIIHFSSCNTLGASNRSPSAFLNATGALAVCGYRKKVDWLESAAFDALLLGGLQEESFRQSTSMRSFKDKLMGRLPDLSERLGFEMWCGDKNEHDAE